MRNQTPRSMPIVAGMSTGIGSRLRQYPSRMVESQVQPVRGRNRLSPRALPRARPAAARRPDRQSGTAVAEQETDLPLAPTIVDATLQPVPLDQLLGQLTPCQGDADAHWLFVIGHLSLVALLENQAGWGRQGGYRDKDTRQSSAPCTNDK